MLLLNFILAKFAKYKKNILSSYFSEKLQVFYLISKVKYFKSKDFKQF